MGAITLFGNLMDYHGALQRYSLQIKGRYIEVPHYSYSIKYTFVLDSSAVAIVGLATCPFSRFKTGQQKV